MHKHLHRSFARSMTVNLPKTCPVKLLSFMCEVYKKVALMKLQLASVVLFCASSASAIELSASGVVVLTPAEQDGMRTCASSGGCQIVTGHALMQYSHMVRQYYFDLAAQVATQEVEAAKAEAAKTCRRQI